MVQQDICKVNIPESWQNAAGWKITYYSTEGLWKYDEAALEEYYDHLQDPLKLGHVELRLVSFSEAASHTCRLHRLLTICSSPYHLSTRIQTELVISVF